MCKFCGSANQTEFSAELLFHFEGIKHLEKPGVLVFPDVMVCFNCGRAEFAVPEMELRQLQEAGESQQPQAESDQSKKSSR